MTAPLSPQADAPRVEDIRRGPFGGMIVIVVEPRTEIRNEYGTIAVVDEGHAVHSGKGALYVTPAMYEWLKAATVAREP